MSERKPFLWVEKYRPQNIDSCVLPETIKKIFKGLVKTGRIGNLLLSGSPGQGKTTVAKALCNELDTDYIFINGSDDRGIDVLRNKVKIYASSVSLIGKKKVIIFDEADYLTAEMQAGLRSVIEELESNCSFIFTCNYKNKIIDALHSRCAVIDFRITKAEKSKLIELAYRRISDILTNESITFDQKVLGQVIINFFPDYRKTINELQKYSQINKEINEGILSHSQDLNIDTLTQGLKDKNFGVVRSWVVSNLDNDVSRIYRKIYDSLKDTMATESIPEAIDYIAEYQYKNAFSADPEICLVACLNRLMAFCQWK